MQASTIPWRTPSIEPSTEETKSGDGSGISKKVYRTTWYDMYACVHAYSKAAEALGVTLREMVKRTSKYCLVKDLGTTARVFLTVFDPVPKTILALWPKMATGYINFGRIEIVENVLGRFDRPPGQSGRRPRGRPARRCRHGCS
ncbi:MAG: hypothetical protein ACOX6T_22225 [Myxococcales bacterium]